MPTAIITGGSRGFGLAVARVLVGEEWDVVVDGRRGDALAAATAGIGPRAHPVIGDVGDPLHRRSLLEQAQRLGDLRLLVNNAGALGPSPLPRLCDLAPDALLELFGVNVVVPLALTQLVLPDLVRSGGAVLNVTSDAAVEAYPGWGAYGASKAALEQISRVLSVEEPDVKVWWLDPGDMRTQMHQDAFPGEDIADRPAPEDVAPAVARLLRLSPPSGRIRASDLLKIPQ